MKITDLFRPSTSVGQTSVNRTEEEKQSQKAKEQAGLLSDDSVSISSLSRQLSQTLKIVADDDSSRQKRVQELKKKVADGTYDVSSEDVAKSIDNYLRES